MVVVFGLVYKGNSDDMRNFFVIVFIDVIKDDVREVRSYDLFVGGSVESLEEVLRGVDVVVIVIDYMVFKNFNWEEFGKFMRMKILIDGRYIIDKFLRGFFFKGIGRGEY